MVEIASRLMSKSSSRVATKAETSKLVALAFARVVANEGENAKMVRG